MNEKLGFGSGTCERRQENHVHEERNILQHSSGREDIGPFRKNLTLTTTLQPSPHGDIIPPENPIPAYPNYRPVGEEEPFVGGGDNSCNITGRFTHIPSGVRQPKLIDAVNGGSILNARIEMIGEFYPSVPSCNCSCGEYRQYVRGQMKKNGVPESHPLCETNLHPTAFQEDCAVADDGSSVKYGYRSIPFDWSKFYNPDQTIGCLFKGVDIPGISGASGDTLEINLDFIGQLIDTCHGDKKLDSAEWSIQGKETVP